MPHLQLENNTTMGKFPNNYVELACPFSLLFFGKAKYLSGIKIFLIEVTLSALLEFLRE